MLPVTSGVVDAILGGVAVEGIVGSVLLARASARHWIAPFALYLASGASLLLALRMALAGEAASWVAAGLLAGLGTHLGSLWLFRRTLVRERA